jgi:hypothetical protein
MNMATRPIALDDYRNALCNSAAVRQLSREGYEEGAVRRIVARIQADCDGEATTAQILVWARRQLDLDSRVMIVRRR